MDLITRLKLDNSQYNSGIDSAKEKTKQFQDTADDTNKSLEDMGSKAGKSAKDLLSEMNKLESAGRSASNYKKQLAEIQKQIIDLTQGYRNMSSEMQQSALGQEVAAKIQELTTQAAQYKDTIMDVNQEIKNLASDTAVWDGLKMGIDTASAALQGFVAMGVLGEKSQEQLVAVIAKLKSIEAATNAVIKVGNALQKNSAMISGVRAVQAKALAKAKDLETAATGRATIAQKLFNKVAMANPYVLLAAALIAVGTALAAFAIKADKAKQEQEKLTKAHEDYMSKMSDSISKMGDAAYQFDNLAKKYKALRTEAEKQKFLEDYKSKLDDLGISVNDINGLEDVFIKRTDDFRRACILRAQAMGLESMQADNYKEMMSEIMAARDLLASRKGTRINEGDPLFEMLKKYNVGQYVARWGKDYITATDEVFDGLEKAIRDHYSGLSSQIDKEQKDLEDQVEALDLGNKFNFNGPGTSGKPEPKKNPGGSSNKEEIKALEGSKKQIQDLISKTQQLRDAQVVGTEEWTKQDEKLKELNNQLDTILGKEARLKNPLPEKIEPIKADIKVPDKIDLPKQKLEVDLEPKGDKMMKKFKEAQEMVSKIQDWFDVGAISADLAKQMIQNLNDELEKAGIKLKVGLEIEDTSTESLTKAVKGLDTFRGVADGFVGSFNDVYESLSSLGEKLSEETDAWKKFFLVFQSGMTILSSVATIIETVATVQEVLNAVKAKGAAAATAEAGATQAEAQAHITNAGAKAAEAIAGASNSAASIPVVGWVLAGVAALALLGTLLAAMSQAKGFAGGGIVPGHNYNDGVIARVSSGEMILNSEQQKKLWKFISEGQHERNDLNMQQVEFKVRGSDLIGALNNYQNKQSRI